MPLYTFKCPLDCGHEEEVLCKSEEAAATVTLGQNALDLSDTDETERLLADATVIVERMERPSCPTHFQKLVWKGMELPQTPDMHGGKSGRFQTKGITYSGQHVDGHFGREARRTKK